MNCAVHFSSAHEHWNTPKELYAALNEEFHFTFDPCPNSPNFDGLSVEWGYMNYCNPPYGKKISAWIQKGVLEASKGRGVVFLIPSRTDTRWWHEFIMIADEIRFLRGRLCFNDGPGRAPFPSAIAIFHPTHPAQNTKEEM